MKLNLRDLFWLIFVAAIVTMWWIDRAKLAGRLAFYETPRPIVVTWPPNQPAPPADPFGGVDPFAPSPGAPSNDPFGGPSPGNVPGTVDPFGPSTAPPSDDPFSKLPPATDDPFAAANPPPTKP